MHVHVCVACITDYTDLTHACMQVLADINHNFYITNRRRHYLVYMGGLTLFEVRTS